MFDSSHTPEFIASSYLHNTIKNYTLHTFNYRIAFFYFSISITTAWGLVLHLFIPYYAIGVNFYVFKGFFLVRIHSKEFQLYFSFRHI